MPPALGTLRSLARSALSCTARPCSSGGRRMAVMAFSCRSRSLATLSKPASSWRPCRSEASAGGRSESGGRGGPRGCLGVSSACPPHPAVPSATQTLDLGPLPVPPEPQVVALAPTSSALRLQHLMPLLERLSAPSCLLPQALVLAAQAVTAKNGLGTPRWPIPPPPTEAGPWALAQQTAPRSQAAPQNALKCQHNTCTQRICWNTGFCLLPGSVGPFRLSFLPLSLFPS